ncbi:MAG: hypothetical protein HQ564_09975 [Candidatus Saganbacteria bacterium]|nr:hypothetical protein [Candidatus Saganbacteria bacterium]
MIGAVGKGGPKGRNTIAPMGLLEIIRGSRYLSMQGTVLKIHGRAQKSIVKIDLAAPEKKFMVLRPSTGPFINLSGFFLAEHTCEIEVCEIAGKDVIKFEFTSKKEENNPLTEKASSKLSLQEWFKLQESSPNDGTYALRTSSYYPKFWLEIYPDDGLVAIRDADPHHRVDMYCQTDGEIPRPVLQRLGDYLSDFERVTSRHFNRDGVVLLAMAVRLINGTVSSDR